MEAVVDRSSVISDLPDDCLVAIFQHLNCRTDREAFGLTCQRWLQIQNATRLHLKLQSYYDSSAAENYTKQLPRLLSRFHSLYSLSLAGCTLLPDSALKHLYSCGSKLQTLCLDCCFYITANGFSLVFLGCPNLTSISLYRCNVTDAVLEILSHSCLALENVNLSYCVLVTDHGISALSSGCPKLQAVTVSYCKGIRGHGFKDCQQLIYLEADSCSFTTDGLLETASTGCLEYLNISNLRCWNGGDGLGSIGLGGSCLRFLNLRMCRFVGNESVTAIAKGCPLLKEWCLALCHEVKALGWEAIAVNCQNLEILHVNRCRNLCDRGLRALQNGCGSLRVLYMHGCQKLTIVGLESFKCLRGEVEVKAEELMSIGRGIERFLLQSTSTRLS
ncbi:F-box/LRR-repeat protein 12 [Nymphaea colorata]|uniref:F-box/LRR-repeat protein 12 n=1 Tax=Nymphaea colorata TaxID=210225 RepID=UPI00129DD2D8|nr:F-box/LRR-repeat protein 12 [Nymphaea colorata]XP_031480732.1 F-box/LRR-repeat protein 12 [Nymphaea colorata]XP_049933023.1 F-box/LRR-repeat protein 12 [Nymphaea colorata]